MKVSVSSVQGVSEAVMMVVEVVVVVVVVCCCRGEALHNPQQEILSRYPGQDDYISKFYGLCLFSTLVWFHFGLTFFFSLSFYLFLIFSLSLSLSLSFMSLMVSFVPQTHLIMFFHPMLRVFLIFRDFSISLPRCRLYFQFHFSFTLHEFNVFLLLIHVNSISILYAFVLSLNWSFIFFFRASDRCWLDRCTGTGVQGQVR